MRMAGLEPARSHPRQILSLMRLPFRHIRKVILDDESYYSTKEFRMQE